MTTRMEERKMQTATLADRTVPTATAETYVHSSRYLDAVCRANRAEMRVAELERNRPQWTFNPATQELLDRHGNAIAGITWWDAISPDSPLVAGTEEMATAGVG